MVNTEGELSRLAARTMRADEMLQASRRIMTGADGTHWSQAASHHGKALYAQGRIADALAMFEQAWQSADKLDRPDRPGALAAGLGGACCATLYDYPQAEQWYSRELDRARSRLVASLRRSLTDLLASARVSQGDISGARELLAEFEGAASNHFLLAYHEGDWEGRVFCRHGTQHSRANGQLAAVGDCASILGRFARIGNQRIEAETYLNEALVASLAGPDLNRELFTRIELALLNADLGRGARAKEQLQRCQQILDKGEDWRGHCGSFAYASAVVSADEHIRKVKSSDELWLLSVENGAALRLPEEVVEGFRAAIQIFRR